MNDTVQKCSRCGATVAAESLQGICPACLLAMNLAAPTEEFGPEGTQVCQPALPPGPSVEELRNLFPQLEILERLGRGGMGAVYKARQPGLDRLVALKILLRRDQETGADKAFAERFCREARALARLAHPEIVAIHDYGEAGGYPYLIMEFVDGLTLRELLKQGKLEPEQALAIVPAICDALEFAHQHGVVHRDIKPENILIDKQGRVKIADFGIAKIVNPAASQPALTGGKDIIGTPHYMAPEQVEQPGKVDHRADIFSLGVVFYEMLTGELPLGKFRPPSSKVRVDVRLDEIVLRALEKEPERRYQHISQVKTDVENVGTVPGPHPNAGGDSGIPDPERKSAAIAAGGLCLAALAMFTTATQVHPNPQSVLSMIGAAGFLSASTFYAKKAWAPHLPRVLPPSFVLLCTLMLALGLHALLETVIRQQPGLLIFNTAICVVIGLGLLFLQRWARILALAWVWVSYILFVVLVLALAGILFPSYGPDKQIEVFGGGLEEPAKRTAALIVSILCVVIAPLTHWLLTRDRIKRLFGHKETPASGKIPKLGFALSAAIVLGALLVFMAMPKQLGTLLSGRITSAATGEPLRAEVILTGPNSREWRAATDRNGAYTLRAPSDAGFLYREGLVGHEVDLAIRIQAAGFEPLQWKFTETTPVSYYKREGNFELQPLRTQVQSNDGSTPAERLARIVNRGGSKSAPFGPRVNADLDLLQIRRVLGDNETNVHTIWLESASPREPRLPVDSTVAISAKDIKSASLPDETFATLEALSGDNFGLSFRMTEAATQVFSEITRTNIGRRLAIIIEGKIISAPVIQSQISHGLGQITGKFTFPELLDLCARLNRNTQLIEHKLVLPDSARGQELLDLDSNRLLIWPTEVFDLNEAALHRRLHDAGVDLFTGPEQKDFTLLGVCRTRFAPFANDAFSKEPPRKEVMATLLATNVVQSFPQTAILQITSAPATYAFCTAEGSIGVMQISAGENGALINYKTLPPVAPSLMSVPAMRDNRNADEH